MNKVMTVGALVLGALGLATALVVGGDKLGMAGPSGASDPGGHPAAARLAIGLPWQIEALPGGASRILGPDGLVLHADPTHASTLADVQRLWPIEHQVAIVAAKDEQGALEAYVDPAQLGFVSGKLVVATSASPQQIQGMRQRALKAQFMESTTRRFTLTPEDLAAAMRLPITGITLIPQAKLDAATLIERFGPPQQRITRGSGDDAVEHLLYPDKGLDIAVGTKGKPLIQYVPPAQFERLMAPLRQR
jgi:hypothetical protein